MVDTPTEIPGANDSVLTVADLRRLINKMKSATPRCPKCGHIAHRAYACRHQAAPGSEEFCQCNVTFELSPVKGA